MVFCAPGYAQVRSSPQPNLYTAGTNLAYFFLIFGPGGLPALSQNTVSTIYKNKMFSLFLPGLIFPKKMLSYDSENLQGLPV